MAIEPKDLMDPILVPSDPGIEPPKPEDDMPEPLKVKLRAAAAISVEQPTLEEKQQVEDAYTELHQFRKLWNKRQALKQLDLGE